MVKQAILIPVEHNKLSIDVATIEGCWNNYAITSYARPHGLLMGGS